MRSLITTVNALTTIAVVFCSVYLVANAVTYKCKRFAYSELTRDRTCMDEFDKKYNTKYYNN